MLKLPKTKTSTVFFKAMNRKSSCIYLENRKNFFLLNETILTEKEQSNDNQVQQWNQPGTTGKLNTRNPEFITFTSDNLQIIILGGINLQPA